MYLQGTRDYKLTYRYTNHLEVIGYSESDFVDYVNTRKSTSRYIFLLVEWAISWRSIKQTIIVLSTMEANSLHAIKQQHMQSGEGILFLVLKFSILYQGQ